MKKYIYAVLLAPLFIISCNDDDTIIENPEEVITTVTVELADANNSSNLVTLEFSDPDGDGGNEPVITTENLSSNTLYNGKIYFLNESVSPADDITEEIREEDEDHQIFYAFEGVNVAFNYTDNDENNNSVGLSFTLETMEAGTGILLVTLRHEPDKFASGVANGDIQNAGGETDVEVEFDIQIQ